MIFDEFFLLATGQQPYAYQTRLAVGETWPDLLQAPTGAGKTEAIVLAWLWRKRFGNDMPRRLVYCLPMRVLVEQTRKRIDKWLRNLGEAEKIDVNVLMGGEHADENWDIKPEREAIFIGTQDMLLSRALNRGYALGRARWPLPYALLNNDCMWVFDEVQLMGSGLLTSAQLAAFRNSLGVYGRCRSLWVSATLRRDWLSTVDFHAHSDKLEHHTLSENEWQQKPLSDRLNASKQLHRAPYNSEHPKKLAAEIYAKHQVGTLTLVVVNTVDRAIALHKEIETLREASVGETLLLHSRFRPPDRREKVARLESMQESGGIVVSTQVIEAGVDLSARVMFTELAPWPSLVQRFGRCNRKGEFDEAFVYWIDLNKEKSKPHDANKLNKKETQPYDANEVTAAKAELLQMKTVEPRALRDHLASMPEAARAKLYPAPQGSVIRRKDALDLFSTTADLTGSDIDISPFVRDVDELNVHVLWRTFDDNPNKPEMQPAAQRDELCPVPIGKLNAFLKGRKAKAWRWDFLEDRWERADKVVPGQIYLLKDSLGGYDSIQGWNASAKTVSPIQISQTVTEDANNRDPQSHIGRWQTLAQHTDEVIAELEDILNALNGMIPADEQDTLREAGRWHDWGKAHEIFQNALIKTYKDDRTKQPEQPLVLPDVWGKSRHKGDQYERPGYRHELASALAMLQHGKSDLACYVVAAHHGKVRTSIRSMPNEKHPEDNRRFARGVYEGDSMPEVHLGSGIIAPAITLSLEPMELGLSDDGKPSWAERVLGLLDKYGPFRLAYLEALLCAADRRASAKPRGNNE
jgi:CRISPR-associated endonuclease/helicase Cas3